MAVEEYSQREYLDLRFSNIEKRIDDLIRSVDGVHKNQGQAISTLEKRQGKNDLISAASIFVAGATVIGFIGLVFKKIGF